MSEETIFREALAKPSAERAAFLDAACAGQPQLRAAVEALLAAHEASGSLLDKPANHGGTGEYTPESEGRRQRQKKRSTPAPNPCCSPATMG